MLSWAAADEQGQTKIHHINANACLTPACSLDGYQVTTVEGIGGLKQGMHPVQQRIATAHGSQCGKIAYPKCIVRGTKSHDTNDLMCTLLMLLYVRFLYSRYRDVGVHLFAKQS